MAQRLRIKTVLRESSSTSFHCILPGHQESNPSATLYRHPQSGVWLYKDHHRDGLCYTLADVRASLAAGEAVKLGSPSTVLYWYERLFAECGLIQPVRIPIRTPPDCSDAVQRIAEGFSLLAGLRGRHTPGEPMPFTRSFGKLWCGVTQKEYERGMSQLEKFGSIKRVGTYREGKLKQCILWEVS